MADVGPGPLVGADCYLYYDAAGDGTGDTWTLIDQVGDVNFSAERMEGTLKRRASRYTKGLPAMFDKFSAEFTLVHGLDKTIFDVLIAAFWAGTVYEFAFMDDDSATTTGEGFRCPMFVKAFPFDQPLEEVCDHKIKLTIGYLLDGSSVEINPTWNDGASPLAEDWDT